MSNNLYYNEKFEEEYKKAQAEFELKGINPNTDSVKKFSANLSKIQTVLTLAAAVFGIVVLFYTINGIINIFAR
jgi:hypothetical protein